MIEEEEYESIVTLDKSREENIKLWRSVEKTPPSQVKPAKLNGQNIKSVKPHYQRMKATEIFGSYGKGWGIVPESETFTQCQIGDTHLLKYRAVLFYVVDGERFEFPICATEKEAYITSGGKGYLKIDDSADKKVATNALTKGLSFLGFSADVFHGLYDDASYVSRLQSEEAGEQEQTGIEEKHEYVRWRNQAIANMLLAQNIGALEKEYFSSLRKMNDRNDKKGVIELDTAKKKRFEELSNKGKQS